MWKSIKNLVFDKSWVCASSWHLNSWMFRKCHYCFTYFLLYFVKDVVYYRIVSQWLDNLGLGYMRNDQSNINSRICLQIIQKRLQYNFIITLHSKMQIKTKCFIYKHLVDNFCLHCYLEKSIPKLYCSEKWSIIRFQQR